MRPAFAKHCITYILNGIVPPRFLHTLGWNRHDNDANKSLRDPGDSARCFGLCSCCRSYENHIAKKLSLLFSLCTKLLIVSLVTKHLAFLPASSTRPLPTDKARSSSEDEYVQLIYGSFWRDFRKRDFNEHNVIIIVRSTLRNIKYLRFYGWIICDIKIVILLIIF